MEFIYFSGDTIFFNHVTRRYNEVIISIRENNYIIGRDLVQIARLAREEKEMLMQQVATLSTQVINLVVYRAGMYICPKIDIFAPPPFFKMFFFFF